MTYKIEIYINKTFIKATEWALKNAEKFGGSAKIEELTDSLATLKKWAKEKFVEVNSLEEYFELIDKVVDVSGNEYAAFGKTIEIGK